MKSDKELAVEFAQAYIQSWLSVEGRRGFSADQIHDLIVNAYNTIHNLSD